MACRSPTPSERGSQWWVLAPAFEVHLVVVAQPALPTPSGKPGARISASPHRGMNGDMNRAATVGAA